MKILVVHGPNLNLLGQREPAVYGTTTLAEIDGALLKRSEELGVELSILQSNSEGAIIDFLHREAPSAQGIVINPGALTHYGLSLRDALAALAVPFVEVHLSNIYAREKWRHRSLTAPLARGQISGLGWRGYIMALEFLAEGRHDGK
ncbi:MAG: type II 3-dehydroquinate dehydratase [Chloroflexi bacterium]|nr:type II 3-dehydroquinate dehydratase [Chloroflexota bacterium]